MVAAICMCKDEEDVIAATVGHMLTQVDLVIVADNMSVDSTRKILAEMPIDLLDDPEIAYMQSAKMSALAATAADRGATWVVPFDADEFIYSPFGRIADVLNDHPQGAIVEALIYDHVATAEDPAGLDPIKTIGWRRKDPLPLPKVACRPRASIKIGQGNHTATFGETLPGLLVVRHFPYRSVSQFVRKVRNGAAAYAATNLPEDAGKHWRDYGRILDADGPEALGDVFRKWFWSADPASDPTLIYDPVS